MKTEADIQAQARRIYNYYKSKEVLLLAELREKYYCDKKLLKRTSDVMKRRAIAGKVLGIGLMQGR